MATIWDCATKTSTIKLGATAPASPLQGDLWVDTSAVPNVLKLYSGTSWTVVSGGGGAVALRSAP